MTGREFYHRLGNLTENGVEYIKDMQLLHLFFWMVGIIVAVAVYSSYKDKYKKEDDFPY